MSWTDAASPEELVAELRSVQPARREAAAVQLGRLAGRQAVDALAQALQQDASPRVRAAAARALGQIGDTRALDALELAAGYDPVAEVRAAASEARARLSGAPATARPFPAPVQRYGYQGFEYLNDPDYRSGRTLRFAGTLVTAIPGGIGLLVGLLGAIGYGTCDATYWEGECDDAKAATIAGFVLLGASLAAGVPLVAVGHSRMSGAMEQSMQGQTLLPGVGLALHPEGARLTLGWVF